MLVHICCSVDSHFFLQKLQQEFPNETLIGFFYDPNIHPLSEYQLRLLDVKRSCQKLGIALHVGEYDYEGWIEAVRGLEHEPEKGKRCLVCFDNRLEKTAVKALEIGEKKITTTLLTSPKKSIDSLQKSLLEIAQKYNLDIIAPDFRKHGGTTEQFAMAKKEMLYHQDYCGCLFALSVQREQQHRLADELSSPIVRRILPASIEERIALYEKVMAYEEKGIAFQLLREKFLNYRLLRAWVKNLQQEVVPSYFLFYSHFKKEMTKGNLDSRGFFSKEEVRFIAIEIFNLHAKTVYKTVTEIIQNPPTIEAEIDFRVKFLGTNFISLSPIIILDTLEIGRYEIYALSKTYHDIRENLALIG
ncbi:MAG: epoxyqueuosine reductase QueH [Campylobacteraceae bacterium]|nr:epoxyqueuosine reductase QueH [Campylobacteraceae bacterium]